MRFEMVLLAFMAIGLLPVSTGATSITVGQLTVQLTGPGNVTSPSGSGTLTVDTAGDWLLTFTWQNTVGSTHVTSGGGGAGMTGVLDFSVVRQLDQASVKLPLQCTNGTLPGQTATCFYSVTLDAGTAYLAQGVFTLNLSGTTFQLSNGSTFIANQSSYVFPFQVDVQTEIVPLQLTGTTVPIPEPATLALLGSGLAAIWLRRRQRWFTQPCANTEGRSGHP